jgi:hypothetical protein
MWQDAFAAKYDGVGKFGREEWDKLLGHCQAVCDWPAVAFAKELIEAYPEAKVLVTTRNVDTWHASTLKTVDWRANDPELKMVSRFDWGSGLYQPMLRKFWDVFFGGDFEKNGKQKYIDYYDDFLEVPVPEGKKFPHTNDTDGFVDRCRARNRAQMMNVAFRALVVGGSVAATAFSAAMTIRRFVGSRGSLLS